MTRLLYIPEGKYISFHTYGEDGVKESIRWEERNESEYGISPSLEEWLEGLDSSYWGCLHRNKVYIEDDDVILNGPNEILHPSLFEIVYEECCESNI